MAQPPVGVHATPSQPSYEGGQTRQHWPATVMGLPPSGQTGRGQSTASQLGPPPTLTEPATLIEPAVPTEPPTLTEPPLGLEPP